MNATNVLTRVTLMDPQQLSTILSTRLGFCICKMDSSCGLHSFVPTCSGESLMRTSLVTGVGVEELVALSWLGNASKMKPYLLGVHINKCISHMLCLFDVSSI